MRVAVDGHDVFASQEQSGVPEWSDRTVWLGQDWKFTVSPQARQYPQSYFADFMLLAGMTIACCLALVAFLWQTSHERTQQVESLNAELETRVADHTRDLGETNKDLLAAIDEERRVSSLLRDRESQLERVFRAGKIGTWDYNLVSGQVVCHGDLKELYGLPPDETPCSIDDFMRTVLPDDRDAVRLAVEEAVAGWNGTMAGSPVSRFAQRDRRCTARGRHQSGHNRH